MEEKYNILKGYLSPNLFKDPKSLISYLKKESSLKPLYETRVRHYTIERHTFFVLQQFEMYFSTHFESTLCGINLFRLFLALHDIGKPIAHARGDRAEQYVHTVKILNKIGIILNLSAEEIRIMVALASGDSLGLYMQEKISVTDAIRQIKTMSEMSGLSKWKFYRLLLIYYQCDAASYTKDAGGIPFLERLFLYRGGEKVFDEREHRLKFSEKSERKILMLEEDIKRSRLPNLVERFEPD